MKHFVTFSANINVDSSLCRLRTYSMTLCTTRTYSVTMEAVHSRACTQRYGVWACVCVCVGGWGRYNYGVCGCIWVRVCGVCVCVGGVGL